MTITFENKCIKKKGNTKNVYLVHTKGFTENVFVMQWWHEDSALLGRNTTSLGNTVPMFVTIHS
jgi:hypothetical protein